MTVPGSVRVTQGEELVRTWWPPEGYGKAFCSQCGSALWSVKPDDHSALGVRLGTFDGDPGVRPQWHAHVAHRRRLGAAARRRPAALRSGAAYASEAAALSEALGALDLRRRGADPAREGPQVAAARGAGSACPT